MHSEEEVRKLAIAHAEERHLGSHRICPLCKQAAGTPRHVIMGCSSVAEAQFATRDVVEAELARWAGATELTHKAEDWLARVVEQSGQVVGTVPVEAVIRWPLLSAWRWLVPIPEVEERIGRDIEHSVTGCRLEGAADLAYRAVMPHELGAAICGLCSVETEMPAQEHLAEEFATSWDQQLLASEAAIRQRALAKHMPAVKVTAALLLGIRLIWYEDTSMENYVGPRLASPDGTGSAPSPAGSRPWLRQRPMGTRGYVGSIRARPRRNPRNALAHPPGGGSGTPTVRGPGQCCPHSPSPVALGGGAPWDPCRYRWSHFLGRRLAHMGGLPCSTTTPLCVWSFGPT